MKRLDVDLVIVNERSSSYIQDLQNEIETAVRSSQSRPHFGEELGRGSVYALRADLMSDDDRTLLQYVARIALIAPRRPLEVGRTSWREGVVTAGEARGGGG